MNKKLFLSVLLMTASTNLMANATTQIFDEYKKAGVTTMNAEAGKALWNKQFKNKKTGKPQNCTTCHGANLKQDGKHVRTGKKIKAMAPSANPKRFTKVKKIKKWFKRNCKWIIGRECSAQEQADILSFLIKQ